MSTFLFNFKAQFADKVVSGEKLQTIRGRRKDGRIPRPGDTVKLFTGLRTNAARAICQGTVTDCFPVQIGFEHGARMIVRNGERLAFAECDSFARLDGFGNAVEMIEWFRATYKPESAFDGFCVRWSPFAIFPVAAGARGKP